MKTTTNLQSDYKVLDKETKVKRYVYITLQIRQAVNFRMSGARLLEWRSNNLFQKCRIALITVKATEAFLMFPHTWRAFLVRFLCHVDGLHSVADASCLVTWGLFLFTICLGAVRVDLKCHPTSYVVLQVFSYLTSCNCCNRRGTACSILGNV